MPRGVHFDPVSLSNELRPTILNNWSMITVTNKAAHERRSATIEIVIGAIKVRVPGGAEARDVEAVLRAVRRSSA